jgi:Txe/YoeB family toxin of Txe-Axe toxin-antitoxin module
MDTNLENPKLPLKYFCNICDFNTCNKKDYNRHLLTDKHINLTNPTLKTPKNPKTFFTCVCGKSYKHSSSLCLHKKKCKLQTINHETNDDVDYNNLNEKDLIMKLLQQNNDLQNQLIEICKEKSVNINNNSNNKTFNLNMFLNETCKNAMNITDFVDSLQLQMSDLENVGEVGYIEGISSIIIKKLNTLDITERPIHCTDKKRETMYIKDQDKWEKEDDKKTKMHKLVTKVANKNINMISEFQKLHPEWKKCSSKYADQHNKIVIESMGGKGDNEYEKQEKIIKKIAKEVFVDKN